MKTLKYLQRFFMLLFVGFAMCAVQACGDDEEDEPSDKPTFGIIDGHEYVDLGLSVKWATCNVGASKPEDYGDYYAWGETKEKSIFSREYYKYSIDRKYWIDRNGDGHPDDNVYQNIGSNISGTQYDVAHVKWGSNWRMPTKEEIRELVNKCSWKWTSFNGVNGELVTGPNGNSIFLPAAGSRDGRELYGRGSCGCYWSAALYEKHSFSAYYFSFDDGDGGRYYDRDRTDGLTVRPITD